MYQDQDNMNIGLISQSNKKDMTLGKNKGPNMRVQKFLDQAHINIKMQCLSMGQKFNQVMDLDLN